MFNGNSASGSSHANKVTGVLDPLGRKLGEPHLWRLFSVIW